MFTSSKSFRIFLVKRCQKIFINDRYYWLHLWFHFPLLNLLCVSLVVLHAQTSYSSFCRLMFPSCAVVPSFFYDNFPSSFFTLQFLCPHLWILSLFLTSACQPFLLPSGECLYQLNICTVLHGPLCMIPFLGFWPFLTLSESSCRPIQVTRLSLCEWGFCSSVAPHLCHTEVQPAGR